MSRQVSSPPRLQAYEPVCRKKPQPLSWRYVDNCIILDSCYLYQLVPLSFHSKCVTKCLDLLRLYRVIHCVVRRLDFILIKKSLKVSTKASVSLVVTVSLIALTCSSLSLQPMCISAPHSFSQPECTELSRLPPASF